ncbi:MAG: restriction endonuclease subunit S [Bacilli bacterium]|nr:restriction endonuclease subunit S [Bacilli bacterium]
MQYKLTDLCNPKQWKTLATSELIDDGKYLVYGANGIIGKYDDYNHKEKTLMITCRGATCGNVHISEPYSYINGNAMCLDNLDTSKCDIKYLYFYLKNYDMKNVISGSAQPQITINSLNKVMIKILPLSEQKNIVKLFEKIENGILIKKNEILKFDEIIKSQFVEMFKNCEIVKLHEIADITMGQSPSSSSYNNSGDGIPFFQGKADYGDKFTIVRHWTNQPTKLAYKNDVLMSVRAPVGPVNISSCDCCIGRGLCAITSKLGLTNNEFLYNALNTIQDDLSSKGTGSTFKAITKDDVYNIDLPLAPIELQNKFAEFVKQIDKQKFEFEKQLKKLEELQASLMQEYFG